MSTTTLDAPFVPTRAGTVDAQKQMEAQTFFPNTKYTYLCVGNSDNEANTITFKTNGCLLDGQVVGDVVVVMAGSNAYRFGPFPPEIFSNSEGNVEITLERPHGTRGAVMLLNPNPDYYMKGILPWQS